MTELIALIILFLSFSGILVMALRKIPQLVRLPEAAPFVFDWRKIPDEARKLPPLKNFSLGLLLQKILSKVRILTLRTEHKTSVLLQKLREDSKKKKFGEDDNYWKEIKKLTKK